MIATMAGSVLVVDADAVFRRLARRTLAASGLEVVGEAATGAEAVALAEALKPDGVLVDIGLPDGDGIALARELAALPWRPRIVLTSTDADAASADDVRGSGAERFVPKAELPTMSLKRLLA
jgi:DNA-binding NarL/FixJ family response regulator